MNPGKTNVTLEDLLRLKRAERPPAEFWAQFEREMRTKELAAIVEPRPWWAPFIRVGARVSRHQLPIGAAAILALSFVTVREYRTYEVNPGFQAELAARHLAPETAVREPRVAAVAPAGPVPAVVRRGADVQDTKLAAEATRRDAAGRLEAAVPFNLTPIENEPSPSARYIAANLAALRASDPRIVDDAFGPAVRRSEDTMPVRDPLAQMTAPSDLRRSRLLASALPVMATAVSLGTSDRVARRLTEDRLYDSVSRVGVSGDRVAIRF